MYTAVYAHSEVAVNPVGFNINLKNLYVLPGMTRKWLFELAVGVGAFGVRQYLPTAVLRLI